LIYHPGAYITCITPQYQEEQDEDDFTQSRGIIIYSLFLQLSTMISTRIVPIYLTKLPLLPVDIRLKLD